MNEQTSPASKEPSENVVRDWSLRLLQRVCPSWLYEEIEGDLIQRYKRDALRSGEPAARRRLRWNAIRFLRPGILMRNQLRFNVTPTHMIRNYFTIALRIMGRNKGYTGINVLGLAMGMTGALLLGLWVVTEFSYDQFHQDSERLSIVWNREKQQGGDVMCWSATPRVLASALNADFSSIESTASFADYNETYLFTAGDRKVIKNQANFVDPSFLTMLSFPMIRGDVKTALNDPNSIVLTEKFAKQLFGDQEALGSALTVAQGEYKIPFTVKGILKDLPSNTDFHFDYLLPFSFIETNFGKEENWGNNSVVTLVKIKPGAAMEDVSKQIRDLKKKNIQGEQTELFLYPLERGHLYSGFENGVPSGGRIKIIRMIALLAVILVLIACINFINLSTARASRRTKEIAIRKVTGAVRSALVLQFLCESVLVALFAAVISIAAAYLLLPAFNALIGLSLSMNLKTMAFWLPIGTAVFTVGLLAGGYPSLYLSALSPLSIFRGGWLELGKSRVRSLLVVMQFGFALTLIVSTVVVYKQTRFLQERSIGYNRNNLIYQYVTGNLLKDFVNYREALLSSGYVSSVTRTSSPVTQRLSNTGGMSWNGKDPSDNSIIERFSIDQHLSTTMGVEIVQGRDLDLMKYPSDSTGALINEAAAQLMKFDNPIGELIRDSGREWHVVGVVKDFVFTSPYRRVEPIVMQGAKLGEHMEGVVHIRLNDERPVSEAIGAIGKVANRLNPDYPFEYQFVDQEYARKFANEETTLAITSIFSGLAIFIGCLGLLGLSTYYIEARIKEIGIRKVLGGSIASIIGLLARSSLRPILWAILLFSPGSWWAMHWWLQTYEYRTGISWWIIPVASMTLLAMAMATIIFQIYRAAKISPTTTLKAE
ncbi:ABC transporter permease [Chryseolinea sp. T2]|uniref:ABC transporter permease n=1 Tax=Chryseolinea sp. T2 TaxID=3129255 RepID=UPI0030769262